MKVVEIFVKAILVSCGNLLWMMTFFPSNDKIYSLLILNLFLF